MVHFLSDSPNRMRLGAFMPQGLFTWSTRAMERFNAARATRKALRQLSEHTDAQLADIGLTRADLAIHRFDKAADERCRAISRLYR